MFNGVTGWMIEQAEDADFHIDLARENIKDLLEEHEYRDIEVPTWLKQLESDLKYCAKNIEFLTGRYERLKEEQDGP